MCESTSGFDTKGLAVDTFFDRLGAWRPQLLSTLRIVTALLFLQHATQKLFHFPAFPMRDGAPPPSGGFSAFMLIGVLELVGSLLLIAGFWTRLTAFILSGEMAIAYWTAHAPNSFFPLLNFGESAILFCFVFLYVAAAGPGPWSIDARQGRR
jgi:putative oxidoreductase